MTRLSRRALLGTAATASAALLSACRRARGSQAADTATAVPGATTAPISRATAVVIPTPPPPRPATPTAAATPRATPLVQSEQAFRRGDFQADPASHDFNADLNCGGDPSLWAGLLQVDARYTLQPDWATSWETGDGGKTWTFHLRPNTGWSNGDPVTAADFIWSWQRLLDPATGAAHAWLLFDIAGAHEIHAGTLTPGQLGVRAVDQWTLEVRLTGQRAYFPAIAASLGTVPAHRASVEQFGAAWTEAGKIVSNGPFQLESWDRGRQLVVSRNPHYWAANISLNRAIAPIVPPSAHTQPFVDRVVDFLPVGTIDLEATRNGSATSDELQSGTEPATWLLIPSGRPPFDTLTVRQALAHAIDRKRLVAVTQGAIAAATTLLPPGFPGRPDDAPLAPLQRFDVDIALAALIGTPFAAGRGWPRLTLAYQNDDPLAQFLANDLAAQLTDNLGAPVMASPLPEEQPEPPLQSADLLLIRADFLYPDPNNGYADALFPPNSSSARLGFVPAGLKELVEQARGVLDTATRWALYAKCETLLQEQVACMSLAHPVATYLVRPWISGLPTLAGKLVPPSVVFTRMTSRLTVAGEPAQ